MEMKMDTLIQVAAPHRFIRKGDAMQVPEVLRQVVVGITAMEEVGQVVPIRLEEVLVETVAKERYKLNTLMELMGIKINYQKCINSSFDHKGHIECELRDFLTD